MSPSNFDPIDRLYTKQLPNTINSIVLVFDDDAINKWSKAKEIFYALPGKVSQKLFMIGHSYQSKKCEIDADHKAPYCDERDDDFNCIDEHIILRSIDVLIECSLKKNTSTFENSIVSDRKLGQYNYTFQGRTWRAITISKDPNKLPHRKSYELD